MKKSGKVEHKEIEGNTSNGEETQQMKEKGGKNCRASGRRDKVPWR